MTFPLSRLRRLPPEGDNASGRAKPAPRRSRVACSAAIGAACFAAFFTDEGVDGGH